MSDDRTAGNDIVTRYQRILEVVTRAFADMSAEIAVEHLTDGHPDLRSLVNGPAANAAATLAALEPLSSFELAFLIREILTATMTSALAAALAALENSP